MLSLDRRRPRRQSCAHSTTCRRLCGGAPVVYEDADAAPDTGCQRKAADPAPPADPLNVQGALPLHSGHEEEKAELLRKVNRLSEIAHLYNDAAEEWFCKYMKYKGHQEARITSLL